MDELGVENTLELQKLVLKNLADRADGVAIVSVTSCNNHSCGGSHLEALERLSPNVDTRQPQSPSKP
jgi:hypothetical protein